jgi:hypothetical protein
MSGDLTPESGLRVTDSGNVTYFFIFGKRFRIQITSGTILLVYREMSTVRQPLTITLSLAAPRIGQNTRS